MLGLRDHLHKSGFRDVALGFSGGMDSALVLALAVDALGKDHVRALMMPSVHTADISLADAADMAQRLGVRYDVVPIAPLCAAFDMALAPLFADRGADVTEENIQARVRGNLLMALSNKHGCMVLSTGNKSELSVGYCTLYGDMAGGLAPLKDIFKTQHLPGQGRGQRDEARPCLAGPLESAGGKGHQAEVGTGAAIVVEQAVSTQALVCLLAGLGRDRQEGQGGGRRGGNVGGQHAGQLQKASAFMQGLAWAGMGVAQQPAPGVLPVADGLQAGQPGIQRAGKGIGQQQRVQPLVEGGVMLAGIVAQLAQQRHPLAQGAGQLVHRPAAGGQQGACPAPPDQLELVAVGLQVPQGRQAHDDIANPVGQSDDQWPHLWIILMTSSLGYSEQALVAVRAACRDRCDAGPTRFVAGTARWQAQPASRPADRQPPIME